LPRSVDDLRTSQRSIGFKPSVTMLSARTTSLMS
jgi:hypothetical protein